MYCVSHKLIIEVKLKLGTRLEERDKRGAAEMESIEFKAISK